MPGRLLQEVEEEKNGNRNRIESKPGRDNVRKKRRDNGAGLPYEQMHSSKCDAHFSFPPFTG